MIPSQRLGSISGHCDSLKSRKFDGRIAQFWSNVIARNDHLLSYAFRCHQLLRFHRQQPLLNLPRQQLRLNHRRQLFPIENRWEKRIGTSRNGKSNNVLHLSMYIFLRYYRPFSEIGLDNYVANAAYFSKGSATFGETQFADLDEEQLLKVHKALSWIIMNCFQLVNSAKDPKRSYLSQRCDIHTYYDNEKVLAYFE